MLLFKKAALFRVLSLVVVMLAAGCGISAGNGIFGSVKGFAILAENNTDEFAVKWQQYLSRQITNRSKKAVSVSLKPDESSFTVLIGATTEKDKDYCIIPGKNRLTIRAKDDGAMLWALYQLLETIGAQNPKVRTSDLPPASISLEKEACGSFAFEYREPYFAPNLDYDYSGILGTNNVERDWGIWGHGLKKVLTQNPNGDLYALVNGKRNTDQYCASAPTAFNQIVDYIANEYGNGEKQSYRFAILPNDNTLVCTCPRCQQLGNTVENATPAFTDLITRLANRFPAHQFFTSAYLTTRRPPAQKLPSNTGVLVSAIDLPLGISYNSGNAATKSFLAALQQWKTKTDHLYVWDYGSDFDDYFTPFPMLTSFQKRLQLFREAGVKGIFLNGSGYEYTTFEDVKTFVAAALLMDPDRSVEQLCTDFFRKQYPVTGKLLSDYYLKLEAHAAQTQKPLPLYSGIRGLVAAYLDIGAFCKFYEDLITGAAKTDEEERLKVKKIIAALSFTRLQVARLQGSGPHGFLYQDGFTVTPAPDAVATALELLEDGLGRFKDLRQYSESEHLTADYTAAWHAAINQPAETNLLLGKTIVALSEPDEEYRDLKMLTDGVHGFEMDYHDGWVISGGNNMVYQIPASGNLEGKKLTVSFLEAPEYNIFLPSVLKVTSGNATEPGKIIATQKTGKVTTYKIDLSNLTGTKLRLEAVRQQKTGKSALACDEIILNE